MFPARGVKPFETRRFVEGLSGPARSSGVGLDQATFASRSNALLHLRASNRPRQVGARRPGSRCECGRGVSPAPLRITTDERGVLNPVVSTPATSYGFMAPPPNQPGDAPGVMSRGRRTAGHPARRAPGVAYLVVDDDSLNYRPVIPRVVRPVWPGGSYASPSRSRPRPGRTRTGTGPSLRGRGQKGRYWSTERLIEFAPRRVSANIYQPFCRPVSSLLPPTS